MAKLEALPEKSIISMLAGVLDFYVYACATGKGIPCVRRWPRYDPSAYPQASIDARKPFGYISSMLPSIPTNLRDAYKEMAGGTGLTWRDQVVRCYINGDFV